MSATRNLGLRHARGKFVAWLDSDDVWLPDKLDVQLALFGEHPEAAMVYGPSLFWYSWTGRHEDANRDFSRRPKMAIDALWRPPVLPISFLRDGTTVPGGVMFRREALLEVGGSEESFRDEFEDIAVYTKICLRRPAYASRRIVYKYRRHDQSCCALTHRLGRKQIRRLQFLKWLAKYLRQNGYQNTEIWNCVQEQLAPFRTLRYMASRCILHLRPIVRPCARLALPTSLYLRLRGDWVEQVSRDIP